MIELDLSENKIRNVEALRKLTNLKKLNLNKNYWIEYIDALQAMTEMIELDLSENKIRNVEALTNMHKLETLSLGTNLISNIDSLSGSKGAKQRPNQTRPLKYLYLSRQVRLKP